MMPRTKRLTLLRSLPPAGLIALAHDWRFWARPNQLPPKGAWRIWARICGRGEGKTRSAAEWCKEQMVSMPGSRGIIVARTIADARDTCLEGESGLLACFDPITRATLTYNRSLGEVIHPNGSRVKIYSSEKPDSLRGVQAHWAWCDEMAAWLKNRAAWHQIPYVVRLPWSAEPVRAGRVVVTTTPQPFKEVRELVYGAGKRVYDKRLGMEVEAIAISRGSTWDNKENLNALVLAELEKLKGTRIGRQELEAELLDDAPGALWTRALIEKQRVPPMARGQFSRIVIGVDPATSAEEDSDETGIVVAGKDDRGKRYVLEDASMRGRPSEWAAKVVQCFDRWDADAIVAEVNQGGDMVVSTIHAVDPGVHVKKVHASRGKIVRAEPIATAYESGDCYHAGVFEALEDQLCTWQQGDPDSPDRLDAMVWAMSELRGGGAPVLSPKIDTNTNRFNVSGLF